MKSDLKNCEKTENREKKYNPIFVLMLRELNSYFSSPVAYIVITLFLLVSGFLLFNIFFIANRAELRQFFTLLPISFALFIPALTMRLFSEEQSKGTIETLMTLPVCSFEVVMGKYLAVLLSSLAMLVPTFIYAITAGCFGSMDFGPLFCGYLGSIFLAATFCAIGIFASSITKNQIVAFFSAFGICIVLALIDKFLIFMPSSVVNFFQFISAGYHFQSIARGIIDSRDLIYFISVGVLFVSATIKILENKRRS
ncbi:MAG: ABC transporter permease subunit [Treponemataceae bacterium]